MTYKSSPITRRSVLTMAGGAAALSAFPAPFVRAQAARKVVFWHSYTQKARSDFMRAAADRFEAATPGVKVEIETVPWPAFPQKWPAAMAGGTLPDVAILLSENAVPMFLAGALHPTDDLVKSLGGAEAFKPGLLDSSAKFRGQYLTIPHYVHNRILVYRKDRLAEAGVKVPVTWDDALQAAVATTKAPDYFGWILKLSKADTGGGFLLWILSRSAGGSFFDADGKVSFTSAPVKEAVEYMIEIARRTSGPGVTDYKIGDNFSLTNSGKTSLTEDSAAIVAGAANDAPAVAEQLDATFMPRKSQVGNLMGGISLGLPKGKNPEDGKAFAQFLMSEQNYVPFLHTIPLFMFPALKRAEGPAFFANPVISRFRNVVDVSLKGLETASLACMEHGLNAYGSPILNAHIVEDMFQRILIDKQPVNDAMAVAARAMEDTIRDVGKRLQRS
jgi:multiple sugar transport system substrate-binding protein